MGWQLIHCWVTYRYLVVTQLARSYTVTWLNGDTHGFVTHLLSDNIFSCWFFSGAFLQTVICFGLLTSVTIWRNLIILFLTNCSVNLTTGLFLTNRYIRRTGWPLRLTSSSRTLFANCWRFRSQVSATFLQNYNCLLHHYTTQLWAAFFCFVNLYQNPVQICHN